VISSTTGASIRTGSAFADQFIGMLQANSEPPSEHECFRNPRRFNEISIQLPIFRLSHGPAARHCEERHCTP
jgi:hypothetical protein